MASAIKSRTSLRFRRGATLIDVAIAVVILSLGVVATLQFMATGTKANRTLSDVFLGKTIAQACHEWAAGQDYATLAGIITTPKSFSPVIDARGSAMNTYNGWSETLTARKVSNTNLTATDPSGQVVELTVSVTWNNQPMYSLKKLYAP